MTQVPNTYPVDLEALEKEAEAIEASKKDISAFAYIYDQHYVNIFRFLHNRVDSEELAADLCSQTFLKAMNAIPKYENRGIPYGSYLYRIARNEINLWARKNKLEEISSAKTSDLEEIEDEISPEEWDIQSDLIELLEGLKKSDLELIEMKYFEKRSYKEMAEILNMNENNLKVKVFRVVQSMKLKIEKKTKIQQA